MEKHANTIEYEVYGNYALFSDPVVRVGGEKTSYSIPTYEALRGITESIFWKPTIFWVIDEIRVMNRIQTETKGIRPIKYNGGNELAYYTYLKDVRYQVRAHFEFNEALTSKGLLKYYDDMEKDIDFGFSYHGITYAEEAVLSEDQGKMTVRFWEHPTMTRGGYIVYPRPEECTIKRHIRKMQPKIFENIEKEEHEKREVKDT